MGVCLHVLLGAVYVAALAGLAAGQQNNCVVVPSGDTQGSPSYYGQKVLTKGAIDWKVTIHLTEFCTGVVLTACDYDKPPMVQFLTATEVYIHRNGRVQLDGSVTAAMYCHTARWSNVTRDDWMKTGFVMAAV